MKRTASYHGAFHNQAVKIPAHLEPWMARMPVVVNIPAQFGPIGCLGQSKKDLLHQRPLPTVREATKLYLGPFCRSVVCFFFFLFYFLVVILCTRPMVLGS